VRLDDSKLGHISNPDGHSGRHDLLGRIAAAYCAPQGIVKSARLGQISGQAGAHPANVG